MIDKDQITTISVLARSKGAPSNGLLYSISTSVNRGDLVRIDFRGRSTLGVVINPDSKEEIASEVKTAEIINCSIPAWLIDLQQWVADKNNITTPNAASLIMPSSLPRTRRASKLRSHQVEVNTIRLNQEQTDTVLSIEESKQSSHLLHGITGSGKTQVYLSLIESMAACGKSSILLVPEIGLSSQLRKALASVRIPIIEVNSKLTTSQKTKAFEQIATSTKSGEAVLVLGPRSALFSPVHNLGFIAIDEAHDLSYFNNSSPYYHAVTVASRLAELSGSKLVLGSATPDIVTYHQFKLKNLPIHSLKSKAIITAREATISLYQKKPEAKSKLRWLSRSSLKQLSTVLENGSQVLVFHNRRGSYPTVTCDDCGFSPECDNCSNFMAAHSSPLRLSCHVCGRNQDPPRKCTECKSHNISYRGLGVQRLENDLKQHFPKCGIIRIDGDSKIDDQMDDVRSGKTQIIVGTQAVIQGYDLPHLKLIIIPDFEHLLNQPDPYSEERLYRTLHQVVGRIGRHGAGDQLIIEAREGSLDKVQELMRSSYEEFYEHEIDRRREQHLPPHKYSLLMRCEYVDAQKAVDKQLEYVECLSKDYPSIIIKGPVLLTRTTAAGKSIAQTLLLDKSMGTLQLAAESAPSSFKAMFEPRQLT